MAQLFDKVSKDFMDAIRSVMEKKLDPVNQDELKGTHAQRKDKDIDNDGDSDKTDQYLHNRRKTISKAIKEGDDVPFDGPYRKAGKRKDEYGNKVKNVAKYLAKKAMKKAAMNKEEVEQVDEISSDMAHRYLKGKHERDYDTSADGKSSTTKKSQSFSKMNKDMISTARALKRIEKAKKTNEEVEQVDEISTKLAIDYAGKASDARGHRNLSTAKLDKRYKSMALAHEKVRARRAQVPTTEEVEQVDEISDKMKHRYLKHADNYIMDKDGDKADERSAIANKVERGLVKKGQKPKSALSGVPGIAEEALDEELKHGDKVVHGKTGKTGTVDGVHNWSSGKKSYMVRFKGAHRSREHFGSEISKATNEEADQIDELSKPTMGRYINKAKDSIDMTSYRSGIKDGTAISSSTPYKSNNPLEKKLSKRHKGIETAVKKLTKEEIEMIEAKLAGVADGAMEGDKHMCATKVFHKEWAEGTPIKTMHADPDADGLIEWYDIMFDHGIERVMTEDMEVLQAESHMHSKKKMKEEVDENQDQLAKLKKDVADTARRANRNPHASALHQNAKAALASYKKESYELDEARGRPKKAGQMDYTVHPKTKEKLMHNNPAHMKKIEALQKNGVLDKPKTEANQTITNQLQKAKLSMTGGATIQFTHGQAKHVSGNHAVKLLSKYADMKPAEKEDFQKKISHSHEQMMKHV